MLWGVPPETEPAPGESLSFRAPLRVWAPGRSLPVA